MIETNLRIEGSFLIERLNLLIHIFLFTSVLGSCLCLVKQYYFFGGCGYVFYNLLCSGEEAGP